MNSYMAVKKEVLRVWAISSILWRIWRFRIIQETTPILPMEILYYIKLVLMNILQTNLIEKTYTFL